MKSLVIAHRQLRGNSLKDDLVLAEQLAPTPALLGFRLCQFRHKEYSILPLPLQPHPSHNFQGSSGRIK